jgi:cytochrome b involved in lipid metabolism
MARLFSEEEVAKHNSAFNCWLVLGSHGAKKVYDVTAFLEDHPGGPEVLLDLAGQDAEDEFQVRVRYQQLLFVRGSLN